MNPPANWYPDPTGRHGQRYWDGEQWTEHVFSDGVQGTDSLEARPAAAEDEIPAATDDAGVEAAVADAVEETASVEAATAVEDDAPDDEAADEEFEDTTAVLFGEREDPAPDAWTPEDGVGQEEASAPEDAVAPEVEPDDVVANVDEVGDAPPEPDFSDAFVLSPETASRLVAKGEATRQAAVEDEDAAPEEAPAADEEGTTDSSGVIDAPPPALPTRQPAPTVASAADLGLTGDLVDGAFAERQDGGAVALQNARLLRCSAAGGVIARQGTMVAYQGDVQFEREGAGGVGRALKRAATGEGLAMMRVTGPGDVFLADAGQHVFLLQLDGGPGLSVNGRNVLAFSSSLAWDIERVKGASLLAGGLFNTTLTGSGWVALVSDGEPVVLRTDEAPTYVDVNALVAWSAGLQTQVVNTVSAKSLVGLGSGEAFQMTFEGAGVVIVQPSEGPLGGGG